MRSLLMDIVAAISASEPMWNAFIAWLLRVDADIVAGKWLYQKMAG
jgi:hypothetical protein